MRHSIFMLALAGAAIGCSSEAEQFVVVVDTDLVIPEHAIGLEVRASSQGGTSADGATFALPETPLPLSFGVLPPEDGSPLVVEVKALDVAGQDVVLRRAIVGFSPVGRMRIPMFIASACRGVACGESETCTEIGCAPAELTIDQVGTLQSEDPETALCRPGQGQCNGDNSYSLCERYGDPVVVVQCGANQHCDPSTIACVDDDAKPTTAVVTVNKIGGGAGFVSGPSGAIDCGARCSAEIDIGTSLVLQASPDPSSTFEGWENAPCAGKLACTFVVMGDATLDARFEPNAAQHTIQLDIGGNGGGRIYSEPAGLDCTGGTCYGQFPSNARVTLRHEAGQGSGFAGWFGDCGGTGNCVLMMDGPRFAAGDFMRDDGGPDVELMVGIGGTGIGRVISNPAGLDCGPQCVVRFARNSMVELFATPEPDNVFKGWEGACTGAAACIVHMSTVREVFAIFDSNVPVAMPRDLNGDGYADLVFGAPGYDVGSQSDVGRVYVVFGPKTQAAMGVGAAERTYQGASGGSGFGSAIAVGDLDGDGYEDLAIGAPGENGHGAVYVLFGGPGLVGSGAMPFAAGPILVGMGPGDAFGATLAIEDLDVDGIGDLIVGAPSAQGDGVGQVFVYAGERGFWPTTTSYVVHIAASSAGTELGRAVAMIGDVDYDGWPDLAIGEPKFAQGTARPGRVSVYLSPAAQGVAPAAPSFVLMGSEDGEAFGAAITGLFDFNQDGPHDFAVASPVKDKVQIYFGRSSWASNVDSDLRLSELGMFGSALAGGHDVTGDGWPDLAVGAPGHLGSKGRVYVYEGASTPSTRPLDIIEGSCVDTGNCAREGLGLSLDIGTDLDGDFVADVVAGSRFGGLNSGQTDRGRIGVFPLPSYTSSGPIPSGMASVLVIGDDQQGAMCAALPGSSIGP